MKKSLLILLALALLAVGYFFLVYKKEQTEPTDTLHITFLDIGQGDATFLAFTNGQQMLIDCAVDARILEALGRVMPFYDHSIDYLVVTHPDLDHYGGCVDVMERFEIAHIIYTGNKKENAFQNVFDETLEKEPAPFIAADRKQEWTFGETTVRELYPERNLAESKEDSNNTSIVLLVEHAGHRVLLTADAEEALEEYLVTAYGRELDVDVLKVGHHGSDSSSIQPFLDLVTPKHAVISSGYKNKYGHPTPRVLKRLERTGANIWRTDLQGDILFSFSREGLYVETAR